MTEKLEDGERDPLDSADYRYDAGPPPKPEADIILSKTFTFEQIGNFFKRLFGRGD